MIENPGDKCSDVTENLKIKLKDDTQICQYSIQKTTLNQHQPKMCSKIHKPANVCIYIK